MWVCGNCEAANHDRLDTCEVCDAARGSPGSTAAPLAQTNGVRSRPRRGSVPAVALGILGWCGFILFFALAMTQKKDLVRLQEQIDEKGHDCIVSPNRSTEGALETSDLTTKDGAFLDKYSFFINEREIFIADLSSEDFDPLVIVESTKGKILGRDTSAASAGHARVGLQVEESGTYYVTVTSTSEGEQGRYRLKAFRSQ